MRDGIAVSIPSFSLIFLNLYILVKAKQRA